MKFKNRPNELVETSDGRQLWISRSVAVAVCILVIHDGTTYVLVNQRGPGVPDNQGLWNMPCGYLDFDETTSEAAIREVWEECGVDAVSLLSQAELTFFDEPWTVASNVHNPKQNVTIHHGLVTRVKALPALTAEHNEPNETTAIRWLPVGDVPTLEFAFNHPSYIRRFVERVQSTHPTLLPTLP